MESGHRTVDEWQVRIGEQVRNARIAGGLDQQRLSELANVSVGAVSNLERGRGSSLKTLVAVARAVGRAEWLDSLAPPVIVSPLQVLRAKQRVPRTRVRVRAAGVDPSRPR
ncbi:MAG: helix-turn-helix transcriptional regulator [Actinomycetota bacterium]